MEVSRTRMKRTADAPVLLQKYKTLAPPRLIYRFLFTVPIYRNQGPYPCDDIMLATEASLLSVSVAIPSATTLITWQWCCIRTDSKNSFPHRLQRSTHFRRAGAPLTQPSYRRHQCHPQLLTRLSMKAGTVFLIRGSPEALPSHALIAGWTEPPTCLLTLLRLQYVHPPESSYFSSSDNIGSPPAPCYPPKTVVRYQLSVSQT